MRARVCVCVCVCVYRYDPDRPSNMIIRSENSTNKWGKNKGYRIYPTRLHSQVSDRGRCRPPASAAQTEHSSACACLRQWVDLFRQKRARKKLACSVCMCTMHPRPYTRVCMTVRE